MFEFYIVYKIWFSSIQNNQQQSSTFFKSRKKSEEIIKFDLLFFWTEVRLNTNGLV